MPLDALESLPPPPPLEQAQFRSEFAETGLGRLEALVPAAEPYRCADPRAPALLLVPGLGMDGLGFIRQLPLGALSRLYFVQTPSQSLPGEEGLGSFTRYVEEYVLALKLDQSPGGLILGGASMGGAISMLAAIRGRIKPHALVLLGTFGSCRHLPRIQRMLAPLAYVIPMAWARRRFWSKEARGPQARVTPDEARWLNWPRIARGRSYYGRAVRALTRLEIIAQARGLTLPATIVHGSDDPVLPPAAATELHQALRGSKLTFVPGAQHSLFFTHHEAVNAAVAAFLREMSQGDLTAETQRTQRTADTR